MKRKSIFYRRLWYAGRRNSAGIHLILRLLVLVSVLFLSYSLLNDNIIPQLKHNIEIQIGKEYKSALSESSGKVFTPGTQYTDIIHIGVSPDGYISAVSLDSSVLEPAAEKVLALMDKKTGLPGSWISVIPITGTGGVLPGPEGLLDMEVKVFETTGETVAFHQEFFPVNQGQTRLVVTMAVEADLSYNCRFFEGKTKISYVLPVGEYIIFGRLDEK